MDFEKILGELRQEKAAIEQAILSIEKLAGTQRRGRPPVSGEEAPKKRGRPKGSKNRQAADPPAAVNAAGGTPQI